MSNNVLPDPLNVQLKDFEGKAAHNTVFGELTTGERVDDISVQLQYSLSAFDFADPAGDLTGTGSVIHSGSEGFVSSGVGVGTAKLVTKDSLRYRPGHEFLSMFTSTFTTGEPNTFQHHGLLNDTDGYYIGYDEADFSVFRLNDSVETPIHQSAFNKDKLDGTGDSGFTLDPTKKNFYKISGGWLGIAPCFFSVYTGAENGWVVFHIIDLVNSQVGPIIQNPSLPITFECGRTSGTGADLRVATSSMRAGVVGESDEDNNSNRRFGDFILNFTVAAGTITHLMALKPRATYHGKSNHVRSVVEIIVSTNQTNKDLVFKAYAPSSITLSTPLIYSDFNTEESVIQISKTAATITELSPATDVAVVLANNFRDNIEVKGFNLYNGDEAIFAVETGPGGGGDVSLQLNWRDEF